MAQRVRDQAAMRRRNISPGDRGYSSIRCRSSYERAAFTQGFSLVAGVDEVGRGCLFGPVFAAAVILDPKRSICGLRDSKVLDQAARNELCSIITARALGFAVGMADAFEIDRVNILQASRLAMRRAVKALPMQPDFLLIDATSIDLPIEQRSLIDGDARCRAIAAASIVAKVHRDACLQRWQEVFPQYNLGSNKGYATPDHRRALLQYGPTFMHRFSFAPVRESTAKSHWSGYSPDLLQPCLFPPSSHSPGMESGETGSLQ